MFTIARTQRPAAKPAAAGAVTSQPTEATPGWPTISLVDSLPRPPTAEADAARPTAISYDICCCY